jgi:hypothetical protein
MRYGTFLNAPDLPPFGVSVLPIGIAHRAWE